MRLFFERQLVGMAITSPEKGWLQVNKKLSEMLGYLPEELSLRTWAEMTYPDDLAADVAQFNRLLSGDIDQYFLEKRFIKKDGAVINTNLSVGCVRRHDGSVDYVLALLEDITEQKRAEKALGESEVRYRNIFETTLEGIYQTNPQGRYLRVNPAFAFMLGYDSPEDLIGSITDIGTQVYVNPERRSEFKRRLSEHDRVENFEAMLHRKDGTTMWGLINGVTVRNENSEILYYTGGMMDITDRKGAETKLRTAYEQLRAADEQMRAQYDSLVESERSLRESEEKYRRLTETAHDIIVSVDLNWKITYVNQATLNIAGGMNPVGMSLLSFTPSHLHELQEAMMQKRREGFSDGTSFEWEINVQTGKNTILEIRAALLTKDEKPSGVLFVGRDITERKRAEEEKRNLEERLNRAEKMEALGQLAGGVAHDLNNVLGVLSGYSELLLLETPKGHRSRSHAEKILQSTEKGAAIIDDLLTLARRGVTAADVISLNSLVSDFFKTPVFEKMKDYHPRVTFRTECDPNLLNIKGSPVHLEKTLINLLSNAAESISGEGEVTIRTESRYIDKPFHGYDEVKEGDYAVLTVSDTGMGIPAENREKIFEPFYTKKTMGRSGTGLGLAIVWGTVKDHNGYIDVQTKVGEGTTFTLYFPVTREERIAPQQKEPIERYMGNGESVLVVDDIAEQRDVASGLLTRLGYEVHVVSSGEEAVAYLKGNKADILVLDMIMPPGIDGLETYQRVLGINPKQKAIIVSGFSETERVKEAQKLGAGAYVKKPYVMEKIGVAIRDELNR
jgi:PAS domain S-box-containing protein